MIRFQKLMLWLAALFALAGSAYVMAFLLHQKPDANLLHQASVAVVFSTCSLLLGVAIICARSSKRLRVSRLMQGAAKLANQVSYATVVEQLRHRQAVLGERLNIDEPRFCTQAKAPCTAWSFCGSQPDESAEAKDVVDKKPEADATPGLTDNGQPLKIIRRTGGTPPSCLAQQPDVDGKGLPD